MAEKRVARIILLVIGSVVLWVLGSIWVGINFGEVVWTWCFFSPFILFGVYGFIYLVYLAFFEKEEREWEE